MIPYHLRGFFKGMVKTLAALVLIAVIVFGSWILWLNRYVVYTRDGVVLDFGISLELPPGVLPVPPTNGVDVDIVYDEGGQEEEKDDGQMKQFSGVFITAQQLASQMDAVEEMISRLPASTPIMLDVKNIRGEFFYSSEMGRRSEKVDTARMDALIRKIQQEGHYLIARMPALRDYWFGLENVNSGIFNPNQMSLWMDEEKCYWLNPGAEGTVTYLVGTLTELRTRGFDEVVLTDFAIPDTENIYFPWDRVETINKFAEDLVKACTGSSFAVSFSNSKDTFRLPEGRTRLVLENVAAADAAALAGRPEFQNPAVQLVFLTELMDTRFEEFSVLRPIVLPE